MPAERYFCPEEFVVGSSLLISGGESQHLVKVMRNSCGDVIELCNGRGTLASAKITAVERQGVFVTIEEILKFEPLPSAVILAQGMPKMNRLDFIVEKGTELGMTHLRLFPGERSEKIGLSSQQRERIAMQLIAAMKQCGRLYLPKVELAPPLAEWGSSGVAPVGVELFGDLGEQAHSFYSLRQRGILTGAVTAFIGPEAGLTSREEKILRKRGAIGVKLHKNILRTETAAIVMLALICIYPDMTGE